VLLARLYTVVLLGKKAWPLQEKVWSFIFRTNVKTEIQIPLRRCFPPLTWTKRTWHIVITERINGKYMFTIFVTKCLPMIQCFFLLADICWKAEVSGVQTIFKKGQILSCEGAYGPTVLSAILLQGGCSLAQFRCFA